MAGLTNHGKDTKDTKETGKAEGQHTDHDIEMIVAWISFIAMIVVNTMAQYGVLFKWKVMDQQDAVFAWFAPARYTNWIWVVIYLLLAVWLIRMTNTRNRGKKIGKTPFGITSIIFILSTWCCIAWICCWEARNYPSVIVLVLAMTVCIWLTFFASRRKDKTFWGWAPFTLWGSWMIVECITDIARAATYYVSKDGKISGFAQSASTLVLVFLLLALACFVRFHFGDWLFGLVSIWAVVGIATRLMDVSKFTAIFLIALATVAAVAMYVPWEKFTTLPDRTLPFIGKGRGKGAESNTNDQVAKEIQEAHEETQVLDAHVVPAPQTDSTTVSADTHTTDLD